MDLADENIALEDGDGATRVDATRVDAATPIGSNVDILNVVIVQVRCTSLF